MRKLFAVISIMTLTVLAAVSGCQAGTEPSADSTSPLVGKTGAPAKLAFLTHPGDGASMTALSTPPVVAIQDSNGNTITGAILPIKLTITSGTGADAARLFGPSIANAVNGTVEFQGISIDKEGSGYTLTASCGDLTPAVSAPFSISPGVPAKLAFTVQPSGGVAGFPFATQPVVTVQDKGGNTVTDYEGSVTVGISFATGPSVMALSGTNTVPVVDGAARFTDLSINATGFEYTLTALSGSLDSTDSAAFTITADEPARLEFTVQPERVIAGQIFEITPKVAIVDVNGNVVTSSRAYITISITPGTGAAGAVLSGQKTLYSEGAMGGLADFDDLSIDLVGAGYTLTATSDDLLPATSASFDVTAS